MARLLLALLLLGALWAAAGGGVSAERPGGACGKPKDIENAVLEDNGSMRLRYSCVKDYKRKAGTSSLIVCEKKKTNKYEWSNSNLRCIRDPSKPFPESEHTTEDTRKGSVQLQAVLLPVVFIMLSFVIAGLWCFYRKHGRFQRQRVVEEIPMAEISEERSKMISADTDLEDAGPSEERTPVQLSDCATSNG